MLTRLLLVIILLWPDEALAQRSWVRRIDGTANRPDVGLGVAFSPNGDVFVAGGLENVATGIDFVLARLVGDTGETVWHQAFHQPSTPSQLAFGDRAYSLGVDAHGGVVASGYLAGHFAVVKVDGTTGNEEWRTIIPGVGIGVAYRLVVAADGAAIAAGLIRSAATSEYEITIAKLRSEDGSIAWRQSVHGNGGSGSALGGLAVHPSGDVIVSGRTYSGTHDFTVARLNGGTGNIEWRRNIPGDGGSFSLDILVARDGSIVAAGALYSTVTGGDFLVIKLAEHNGATLWASVVDGTAHTNDIAYAVGQDAAGNFIATGFTVNIRQSEQTEEVVQEITTVKFDQLSGAELLREVISTRGPGCCDNAERIALDGSGRAYLAAHMWLPPGSERFAVVDVSLENGKLAKVQTVRGDGKIPPGTSAATAVAVGPDDSVVAVGYSWNSATSSVDLAVMKIRK